MVHMAGCRVDWSSRLGWGLDEDIGDWGSNPGKFRITFAVCQAPRRKNLHHSVRVGLLSCRSPFQLRGFCLPEMSLPCLVLSGEGPDIPPAYPGPNVPMGAPDLGPEPTRSTGERIQPVVSAGSSRSGLLARGEKSRPRVTFLISAMPKAILVAFRWRGALATPLVIFELGPVFCPSRDWMEDVRRNA